jgi:hypothetical protein
LCKTVSQIKLLLPLSKGIKRLEHDAVHSHLVPKLKIGRPIPPRPYTPPQHVKGKLYL